AVNLGDLGKVVGNISHLQSARHGFLLPRLGVQAPPALLGHKNPTSLPEILGMQVGLGRQNRHGNPRASRATVGNRLAPATASLTVALLHSIDHWPFLGPGQLAENKQSTKANRSARRVSALPVNTRYVGDRDLLGWCPAEIR